MAYSNYFPQYYQPMQPTPQNSPQNAPYMPQQQNNGIVWVQGEAAAKAYPVAPGQAVLLMDSETSSMYIKSTDQSGMPQPLRIFDYTERSSTPAESVIAQKGHDEYVTREEFEAFRDEIKKTTKGIRKPKIQEDNEE